VKKIVLKALVCEKGYIYFLKESEGICKLSEQERQSGGVPYPDVGWLEEQKRTPPS
jgi:hypothetical protein